LFTEKLRIRASKVACLPQYYQDFKKLYRLWTA
jgi:hypothetical protein